MRVCESRPWTAADLKSSLLKWSSLVRKDRRPSTLRELVRLGIRTAVVARRTWLVAEDGARKPREMHERWLLISTSSDPLRIQPSVSV